MNFFLFSAILASQFLTPNFASGAPSSAEIDRRAKRLTTLFEKAVVTVKDPFATFHWQSGDASYNAGSEFSSPEGFRKHLKSAIASSLEQNFRSGFYVAIDPLASREYGGKGDDWRLIQIDFTPGTSYLDLAGPLEDKLSGALLASKDKCQTSLLEVMNPGPKVTWPGASSEECKMIQERIFRKLGINAVRYRWTAAKLDPVCSSQSKPIDRSAFVLLNDSWIGAENLNTFVASDTKNPELRRVIQDSFFLTNNRPGEQLWSDMSPSPNTQKSSIRWMRKNLINCQGQFPPASSNQQDSLPPETAVDSGADAR